jgi:hypothetical protein
LQHLREVAQQSERQDWVKAVRKAYEEKPEAFPAVLLPLVLGTGAFEGSTPEE